MEARNVLAEQQNTVGSIATDTYLLEFGPF